MMLLDKYRGKRKKRFLQGLIQVWRRRGENGLDKNREIWASWDQESWCIFRDPRMSGEADGRRSEGCRNLLAICALLHNCDVFVSNLVAFPIIRHGGLFARPSLPF